MQARWGLGSWSWDLPALSLAQHQKLRMPPVPMCIGGRWGPWEILDHRMISETN